MTNPDNAPQIDTTIDRLVGHGETAVLAVRRYFAGYFWFILKNVIGWLLILLSAPAGALLPGPGGIPMFLIGFTLVALPGKRKLTSRVMRGRPLRLEAGIFTFITTFVSLVAVTVLLFLIGGRYTDLIQRFKIDPTERTGFIAAVGGICAIAGGVTWIVTWLALKFVNVLIRLVPWLRRKLRPLLRKYGLVLLPPPKRNGADAANPITRETTEILELSDASRMRLTRWWAAVRPWARRVVGFALIAAIFYFILRPVFENWRLIEPFVNEIRPLRFLAAVLIYSAVAVLFRVAVWWLALRDLGTKLAVWPAVRIWSLSELTRYLPAAVRPVAARAWMLRRFDTPQIAATTSQLVEGVLTILSCVLLASAAALWVVFRGTGGATAWWAASLAPIFFLIVAGVSHPRVFYRLLNTATELAGRGKIDPRVPARTRLTMMGLNAVGFVLLGVAVWLIARGPLHLGFGMSWLLGGAYAFAWVFGRAVAWTPAGMGVREIAFMAALLLVLPASARAEFDPGGLTAFAAFLAVLLRVWSTAGEVIVAVTALVFDLDGALDTLRDNRPPLKSRG